MTQLLISVKNVEEALLALYAGIKLIDLKDPNVGALGALHKTVVAEIVNELSGLRQADVLISATVGEAHQTVSQLITDVRAYSELGVDIVKIAASDLLLSQSCLEEIEKIIGDGVKLVAVFFAENSIDLTLLAHLAQKGFYGAMVDTQLKSQPLLALMPADVRNDFVMVCKQNVLISGLAGSVNETHIKALVEHQPDFIGMRGGLCEERKRTANLSTNCLQRARKMLLTYNNTNVSQENRSKAVCNWMLD